MDKNEFQQHVTETIVDRDTDSVNIGITENKRAIVIAVDDEDAAYTADEARDLADEIDRAAADWPKDPSDVTDYIRDMADVVDGLREAGEVQGEWENRGKQEEM